MAKTHWWRALCSPKCLALPALSLVLASPARGQLPDAFASHFGASRTQDPGIRWSAGAGLMLLSQYGSRWVPGDTLYTSYDSLHTTVGYNYFSLGRQWSGSMWRGTGVVSAGVTLGVTSDRLTRAGQNALHNFLRFPHVRRDTVDSGTPLWGGEVEASWWWTFKMMDFDLDLHPNLDVAWSSYHRETSFAFSVGMSYWKLHVETFGTLGLLMARSGIRPAAVAARLKRGYGQTGFSLALDRTRLGGAGAYLPTAGVAVNWSNGIFIGQRETLMSVFLDIPAGHNNSIRLEFLNDLLRGKDRGPTGGLRLFYVWR